jgi:hypothetical protein
VLAWEGAAVDGQSIPHLHRPRSVEAAALIPIQGQPRFVPCAFALPQSRRGTYRPQISFFDQGMRAKKQHPVGLFGRNAVHGTQSTQSQSCWKRGIFVIRHLFFCNAQGLN